MATNDYPGQFRRLQTEQNKAIDYTKSEINQWLAFKSDYEALKKRLRTLPDQLTHEVMVPFGKMAFMPGQLVHTNEILVLLGDNWFVDRSAKQAAEIVDRRMETVNKHLQELENQLKLLEPRRDFTSELENMSQEAGGMFEIREDYDEETEQAWKVQHKKHVQEYRQRLKKEERQSAKNSQKAPATGEPTDEELWDRLNQLMKIETERREIHKVGTSAEERLKDFKYPTWSNTTESNLNTDNLPDVGGTRYCQGDRDNNVKNSVESDSDSDVLDSDDDDDELSDDDESSDDDETCSRVKGNLITFAHTKVEGSNAVSGSHEDIPITPGDIYTKLYQPKSILKKSTETRKKVRQKVKTTKIAFDTGSEDDVPVGMKKPVPEQRSQMAAFSGTVLEKSSTDFSPLPSQQREPPSALSKFKSESTNQTRLSAFSRPDTQTLPEKTEETSNKPVSKFRAQRLNKEQK